MGRINNLFKKQVSIIGVGTYVPKNKVTSDEIENIIREKSNFSNFSNGTIFEISGTYTRYFASDEEQSSTLAIHASQKAIIHSGLHISDIDCIIFASASHDITEPATANIIQFQLGSSAPVFDVKNACNSFLNGIQIAENFLKNGTYKNILVCSGETPSRAIQWSTNTREEFKGALAGYNLGDAGVAMVLSLSKKNKPTIRFLDFYSKGEYYNASTILGGGSCYPRDLQKYYFTSDSKRLSEAFGSIAMNFVYDALRKYGWRFSSTSYFLPHIVSRYSLHTLRELFPIPHHKILNHNNTHGNMASCSIPYALIDAMEENKIKAGDKVLIMGLGAGASFCVGGIQF